MAKDYTDLKPLQDKFCKTRGPGRPSLLPAGQKLVRYSIDVSPGKNVEIRKFMKFNGIKKKADAVRILIDLGLKEFDK